VTNGATLFAEGEFDFWTAPGSNGMVIAIILGVVFLIAAVGLIWAAAIRSPKKKKHSYHRPASSHADTEAEETGESRRRRSSSVVPRFLRRKRRHHHQQHRERPANPTLAQVGGLPARGASKPPIP
jgi:hypothetical protein